MGMAKLNVWISGMDDPCTVSRRTWFVTIYDCDGNVLQWCGKRFLLMPARCGHLHVEVPPGCYYLKAVWSYWVIKPGYEYRVNHFTDAAIVQACCEQTTCVKLFNPSAHRCGTIFVLAAKDLLKQKLVRAENVKRVTAEMNELLRQLPEPLKGFELAHIDEVDRLMKKQGEVDDQEEQKPAKE
jgi:hypothetical protein